MKHNYIIYLQLNKVEGGGEIMIIDLLHTEHLLNQVITLYLITLKNLVSRVHVNLLGNSRALVITEWVHGIVKVKP